MISREDFRLMAVGKFVLGKPSVKSEDYLTYLEGATYAFDKLTKAVKNELADTEKSSFTIGSEGSTRNEEQPTSC